LYSMWPAGNSRRTLRNGYLSEHID